jgi:hypothetical protein
VETNENRPSFRPRISLFAALLLMTIVGMALAIVHLGREVVPLRNEVRSYRSELGILTIDDPTRVQGVQMPTEGAGWKWKLYFPPGGNYKLRYYSGMIPEGVDGPERRDFAVMNPVPEAYFYSFGGSFLEEKVIEARFKQLDDKWVLQVNFGGGGWRDLQVDKDFAQYLSNARGILFPTSNLNSDEQTMLDAGERMFLIKCRKMNATASPSGGVTNSHIKGPAPGVALWIEEDSNNSRRRKGGL